MDIEEKDPEFTGKFNAQKDTIFIKNIHLNLV